MGKKKSKKYLDNFITNNIYPYNFNKKDFFFWPTIYYKKILKKIESFKSLLIKKEEEKFLLNLINNLNNDLDKNKDIINICPLFKEIIEKMELKKVTLSEEASFVQKIINNFNPSKTFYIKDIFEEYFKKYGKKISKYKIYKILKNCLKFRFIKTSIKPNKIKSERGKLMNLLFYKTIVRGLFIGLNPIYLDESGFQLFNNKYYRWRKREDEFPYGPNGNVLEKSNMIIAVSADSILLYQINKKNTDNKIFEDFVENLIKKIPESQKENNIIIMDNAKFHLTENIKKKFQESKIKVLTIAPYNSDQNMCELVFRHLKLKIRKLNFKSQTKMITMLKNILEDEKLTTTLKKLFKTTLIYYKNYIENNDNFDGIEDSFNKLIKNK